MRAKFISILYLALVTTAIAQTEAPKPITVGVLTVAGPRRTLANNITALMTADLSSDPHFAVVDRNELDKVLREQALGTSGSITPDTAAKIGQLTGAKVLITGREFNGGSAGDIVVIASIIGTENGRVFSMTTQGASTNLVELISDLSQKIAQTIVDQSTNILAPAPVSREKRVSDILSKVHGKHRPAVLVTINEQMPSDSTAQHTAETELGLLLQKAGFTAVDEKSRSKADIIITGDAMSSGGQKAGSLVSSHAILAIKAEHRKDGKIVSLDRQEGVAVDISESMAAKEALQNATDDLSERLLPLLAQ